MFHESSESLLLESTATFESPSLPSEGLTGQKIYRDELFLSPPILFQACLSLSDWVSFYTMFIINIDL